MAALHDALKTLGPADYSDVPLDDLKPFLSDAFSKGQLIVESVPIPAPSDESAASAGRSRSDTISSIASSASEISLSSARSSPPPAEIEALQKEWKPVKLKPSENPLGMGVYKLAAKDGKGAWFARRSVHEGLGFTKWKKGLEREFPETMKVQGGPGEGNIRGIGGERRVEYKNVDGVGKMEVYLLSAQFPGPTTPRDFVTMFLTSDQALSGQSGGENEVPRHFMVVSKPCIHPDTTPREGYIRGSYESVEFIREIPIHKQRGKSASTTNLSTFGHNRNRSTTLGKEAILRNATKNASSLSENDVLVDQNRSSESTSDFTPSEGRARGRTISFDSSRGHDAKGEKMDIPQDGDDSERNPIEWIMITRSDPGGSVPRFMVERGTPGGIVSDASKFLNWACSKGIEDFDSDDETLAGDDHNEKAEPKHHHHNHEKDLHNFQTNGHLAGLEEESTENDTGNHPHSPAATTNGGGIYDMFAGAAGAAGALIASHTPAMISDHFPGYSSSTEEITPKNATPRQNSLSTISSASSYNTFTSALENYNSRASNDGLSTKTSDSAAEIKATALKDKELQKLEERKRKLDEKLNRAREKEISKKTEDSAKEEEALRKAEEKHQLEIKKQEEKYKKEVEKLERKKLKETQKSEARKRKAAEKDERTRLLRELEEVKAEVSLLRKEKDILRMQVGDLQAENTALAARVGRLGGEDALRTVRDEVVRGGRLRANSLKAVTRAASFRSSGSAEKLGERDSLEVPVS